MALNDTGLIGATTGRLTSRGGFSVPIRQVPGPSNRGIPLSQAGGQLVSVCGTFVQDGSQWLLSVTSVRPLLLQ